MDDTEVLTNVQEADSILGKANIRFMQQLCSRLAANPNDDLSKFLAQEATVYSQLRGSASKAVRNSSQDFQGELSRIRLTQRSPLFLDKEAEVVHHPRRELADLTAPYLHDWSTVTASNPVKEFYIDSLNHLVQQGKILALHRDTMVLDLGKSMVVKIGPSVDISQVKTIDYIQDQGTDIPIPRVLGVLKSNSYSYFFMSKAEGIPLSFVWTQLNLRQRRSIQKQLSTLLRQLRSIRRPEGIEEGLLGGGDPFRCRDLRRKEKVAKHPIATVQAFHDFLCSAYGAERSPQEILLRSMRSRMQDDYRVVLTHGSLSPEKVMVTWTGFVESIHHDHKVKPEHEIRITSLLDWEASGWYPEYWEFAKACALVKEYSESYDWFEELPIDVIGNWDFETDWDYLLNRPFQIGAGRSS